jgi:catechol 2,3-dioxygenase-like lactoylglutathione lyase family enzyme
MPIEGIDHVAITVADVETTVAWYERVLDAEPAYLDLWRQGKIPVVILQLGVTRLSVHDAARPGEPKAAVPTVGAADICFRWKGSLEGAQRQLAGAGVPIEEGPVGRPASNGIAGESIYFRDPDGNLIELLSID